MITTHAVKCKVHVEVSMKRKLSLSYLNELLQWLGKAISSGATGPVLSKVPIRPNSRRNDRGGGLRFWVRF